MSNDPRRSESNSSQRPDTYEVIIIGSGPAGYTAGVYTSRAKLNTLLISGSLPGGQLMTTSEVENYPGFPNGIFGPELMMNMRQQAERFGAKLLDDEVVEVDFKRRPFGIKTHGQEFRSESVVIWYRGITAKAGIESRTRVRR